MTREAADLRMPLSRPAGSNFIDCGHHVNEASFLQGGGGSRLEMASRENEELAGEALATFLAP
jgi:hypothetical protein